MANLNGLSLRILGLIHDIRVNFCTSSWIQIPCIWYMYWGWNTCTCISQQGLPGAQRDGPNEQGLKTILVYTHTRTCKHTSWLSSISLFQKQYGFGWVNPGLFKSLEIAKFKKRVLKNIQNQFFFEKHANKIKSEPNKGWTFVRVGPVGPFETKTTYRTSFRWEIRMVQPTFVSSPLIKLKIYEKVISVPIRLDS